MAEAKLPEEIIREIVRHIIPPFSAKTFLKFPEQDTPYWKEERPGALQKGSTNILLISKRWLRIAAPMLYTGVALRKSKHTSTLARLVKTDPAVARAIRYLRLEGGSMSRELSTLLRYATNIHTLYVTAHLRSGESLEGLRRAAHLVHPTTLYIHFAPNERHSYWSTENGEETVLRVIVGLWTAVTEIHFSAFTTTREWTNLLMDLPALREIHMPTSVHLHPWFERYEWERGEESTSTMLEKFAEKPGFEQVVMHGREPRALTRVEDALKQPKLNRVAKFVSIVEESD